jgi:hypothetical protein
MGNIRSFEWAKTPTKGCSGQAAMPPSTAFRCRAAFRASPHSVTAASERPAPSRFCAAWSSNQVLVIVAGMAVPEDPEVGLHRDVHLLLDVQSREAMFDNLARSSRAHGSMRDGFE